MRISKWRLMKPSPRIAAYTLMKIAETGDVFSNFAPYVASINNRGEVAFQAELSVSGSGIYLGSGGPITTVVDTADGVFRQFISHPDVNDHRCLCFYAERASGEQGVFLSQDGQLRSLAETNALFTRIGPLGPSINEHDVVAFRSYTPSGQNGIYSSDGDAVTQIALSGETWADFAGIPVISETGTVAFRADTASNGSGLYTGDGKTLSSVAEVGVRFRDLVVHPGILDMATVTFGALLTSNGSGIFTSVEGELRQVMDTGNHFECFRSALFDEVGRIVFVAIPKGGQLGIFTGPDPEKDRILGIGDPLFDSTIATMALNPVSINKAGQLAIRVCLTNERQYILRADPSS